MSDWLDALAESSAHAATAAKRALVSIETAGRPAGSGILWAPKIVVTNAHVARRQRQEVRLSDGRETRAKRVAWDLELDLAILEFDGPSPEPARIGDSDALRPGEWVYALGNPWGVRGGATAGVVIASEKPAFGRKGSHPGWLALALHLRPGHSGGPVVNAHGNVVGVNRMMNGPEVGLAIPSNAVAAFLWEAGIATTGHAARRAA
jgi:serine protease Do